MAYFLMSTENKPRAEGPRPSQIKGPLLLEPKKGPREPHIKTHSLPNLGTHASLSHKISLHHIFSSQAKNTDLIVGRNGARN